MASPGESTEARCLASADKALLQDRRHTDAWLNKTIEHVDKHPQELQPVLKEFKAMVEEDTRLFCLFT